MLDWVEHWMDNIFYAPLEPFINVLPGGADTFFGIMVTVLTIVVFIGSKRSIPTTVGAMMLFSVFFALILPVTILFLFMLFASILSVSGVIYVFKSKYN